MNRFIPILNVLFHIFKIIIMNELFFLKKSYRKCVHIKRKQRAPRSSCFNLKNYLGVDLMYSFQLRILFLVYLKQSDAHHLHRNFL